MIVTLTTDLGLRDHYVASMKGVMLGICPGLTVVDVSHDVPKYDVRSAAFTLFCAYKHFPAGTIHVVVVDPGVGSGRRAMLVRGERYVFIGPDNGVLMMAAGEDGVREVYEITRGRYLRGSVSFTFHGRDVFAPLAAHVARGVDPGSCGEAVSDYVVLEAAEARVAGGGVEGCVVHVDGFGNVITNISGGLLRDAGLGYGAELVMRVEGRGLELRVPLGRTFGVVPKGRPILIVDSEGLLELAVNMGNAAERFGLRVGDEVSIA